MICKNFQTELGKIFSILFVLFFVSSFSQSPNNCQGKTLTIGAWGILNTQNPHYQYLHNGFPSAFPGGVTLGCPTGNQITLYSANEVNNYMNNNSGTGTPAPINVSANNTLLKQLLGVKLAVGLSNSGSNFAASNTALGNYTFTGGAFMGMTVNQFLQLADNFIGGCATSSYTASQFNAAATAINQNYDEGTQDHGYLTCCSLSVHIAPASITCFGEGTILHAAITGASSAAQISWYKNNVLIPGENSANLAVTSGNATYKVVVNDAACTESDTEFVEEPDPITFSVKPFDNACNGQTRQVEVINISGGTLNAGQGYSVIWTNTVTGQQYMGNPVNLPQGSYSVVVSDSKSCHSEPVSVTVNENPQLNVSFSGQINCYGGNTTLTATATGGSGIYSNYIWKKDGGVVQAGASNTLPNATAGNYTVEVIDNIGCTSGDIAHQLDQPTEIAITVNGPIETACYQGTSQVSVSVTGGTLSASQSEYVYEWYQWSGSGYSSTVFATGNPVNLPKGKYKVVVTDANNCTKTQTDINVNEYPKLVASISGQILCNGQTATLTASATGGTGNYTTYQWWKNGIDQNNNSNTLANAGPGVYKVKIWDSHNCTNPEDAELNLVEPSAITLQINSPDVICYGGTSNVTVEITGGTPNPDPSQPSYTVIWSQNGTVVATGTSVDLAVGTYLVTVTDFNNCPKTATVTVKPLMCQGTTITLGGWGAPAQGTVNANGTINGNWGLWRDTYFAAACPAPNYLTIGSGGRKFTFTTAAAVRNFLTKGGTPAILPVGSAVNPANNKNTLANNVVALTLNINMDTAVPVFSSADTQLANMIVISGPMAGSTVQQVLDLANQVLGGTSNQFTPSAMNAIVDAINNNFDDGKTNNGYLACPCPVISPAPLAKNAAPAEKTVAPQKEMTMVVYPNPTKGDINLKVENAGESVSALLYDVAGRVVADLSRNFNRSGNAVIFSYSNSSLADGFYILRVKSGNTEKSFKIIVRK